MLSIVGCAVGGGVVYFKNEKYEMEAAPVPALIVIGGVIGILLDIITAVVLMVLAKKLFDQGKISLGDFRIMDAFGKAEVLPILIMLGIGATVRSEYARERGRLHIFL